MSERFGEQEIRRLCGILYDNASGRNVPHVKALCDEIEDRAAEAGLEVKRKEGYEQGRWIVLDFGFVLVHLFHPEERAYYNMERLWEEDGSTIHYPEAEKKED